MNKLFAGMFLGFIGLLFSAVMAGSAPVTVLAPSKAIVETLDPPRNHGKNQGKMRIPPVDEVDMLMALLDQDAHGARDMDMPQFFAALYYPPDFELGQSQPELLNLLGDVEEIRYLDKKAWGANVSVARPGLYQFILEGKPWWDSESNRYLHEQAKVVLPVAQGARGWEAPSGQSLEILPLTRPFGFVAPALFSAKVLLDGKPLENIPVHMGRVSNSKIKTSSRWQQDMEARSNAAGEFAFVLSEPGWWYCEASIAGDPLKGPDGEMRELVRSTVFWLYVASAPEASGKK